jgi:hypothetical protein
MSSAKVRDVPADQFIKAYAAHLKANDKVMLRAAEAVFAAAAGQGCGTASGRRDGWDATSAQPITRTNIFHTSLPHDLPFESPILRPRRALPGSYSGLIGSPRQLSSKVYYSIIHFLKFRTQYPLRVSISI